MHEVVFQEEEITATNSHRKNASQESSFSKKLVDSGLVKSTTEGDKVLIGAAIGMLVFSGFIIYSYAFPHTHPPTAAELAEVHAMTQGNTQH